jgi:hypothetical protein
LISHETAGTRLAGWLKTENLSGQHAREKKRGKPQQKKKPEASTKKKSAAPASRPREKSVRKNRRKS